MIEIQSVTTLNQYALQFIQQQHPLSLDPWTEKRKTLPSKKFHRKNMEETSGKAEEGSLFQHI